MQGHVRTMEDRSDGEAVERLVILARQTLRSLQGPSTNLISKKANYLQPCLIFWSNHF